jgi:hypothetical protein
MYLGPARVDSGRNLASGDVPDQVWRIDSEQQPLSSDRGTFRTIIDAMEQVTGYDLLSNVPKAIQKGIEPALTTAQFSKISPAMHTADSPGTQSFGAAAKPFRRALFLKRLSI